jgi:hypothetical protein
VAWLAKLDVRSRTWRTPIRWSYLALKWYLVTMGGFSAVMLAYQEWTEGRVALGTGIVVAIVVTLVKGVTLAVKAPANRTQLR